MKLVVHFFDNDESDDDKEDGILTNIMSANLAWMVRNQNDTSRVIWEFDKRQPDEEFVHFKSVFNAYAVPFFSKISDKEYFEYLMGNFDEVNNLKHLTGFFSSDPISYTAISLFYSGRPERAFALLDNALMGRYPASVKSMVDKDEHYGKVTRCRAAKVKQYLLGQVKH